MYPPDSITSLSFNLSIALYTECFSIFNEGKTRDLRLKKYKCYQYYELLYQILNVGLCFIAIMM